MAYQMHFAKFRRNGVTYTVSTRNIDRRNAVAALERENGCVVETWSADREGEPPQVLPLLNGDRSEIASAPAEAAPIAEIPSGGGGASGTDVVESPF